MGTIVCQSCNKVIEHFDYEKATVLFGKCDHDCDVDQHEND